MLMDLPKTPIVNVYTTNNRGFTPEIRDQAIAFKNHLEKVIAFYMKEAIKSDRTTVYNAIKDAGHENLAEYIRRM